MTSYKSKEKVKAFFGYLAMTIIVMAWVYPVFFLLVNANKTAFVNGAFGTITSFAYPCKISFPAK